MAKQWQLYIRIDGEDILIDTMEDADKYTKPNCTLIMKKQVPIEINTGGVASERKIKNPETSSDEESQYLKNEEQKKPLEFSTQRQNKRRRHTVYEEESFDSTDDNMNKFYGELPKPRSQSKPKDQIKPDFKIPRNKISPKFSQIGGKLSKCGFYVLNDKNSTYFRDIQALSLMTQQKDSGICYPTEKGFVKDLLTPLNNLCNKQITYCHTMSGKYLVLKC